jgi:hypothetical protein
MQANERRKLFQLVIVVGIALVCLNLLISLVMVWRNVQLYRESQNKAVRVQRMEADMREWQSFMADLVEYSRRQPAIEPILQKYVARPPSPTSKP